MISIAVAISFGLWLYGSGELKHVLQVNERAYDSKLSSISRSDEYERCRENPTSECLIGLAIKALPSPPKFSTQAHLDDTARSLSLAGRLPWVIEQIEASPRMKADDKRLLLKSLENIEVATSIKRNDKDHAERLGGKRPGIYFIGVLFAMQDHQYYGGGNGALVKVERLAMERRPAIPITPALNVIIEHWERSIPESNETGKPSSWLNYANTMLKLGLREKAENGYQNASESGLRIFPFRDIRDAIILGAHVPALATINTLVDDNYRIRALGAYAAYMSTHNNREISADFITETRRKTNGMKDQILQFETLQDLVRAAYGIGDLETGKYLIEGTHELARERSPFKPFRLLDIAELYFETGDNDRALDVLAESATALPDKKTIVAFGLISGPVTLSGGLLEEYRSRAAALYCELGKFDKALSLMRQVEDKARQRNNAANLIECIMDEPEWNSTPTEIAEQLETPDVWPMYFRKAAVHVTRNELEKAVSTLRDYLAFIRATGSAINRYAEQEILRLGIVMRHVELLKEIMRHTLEDAVASPKPQEFVRRLSSAAAIVHKVM